MSLLKLALEKIVENNVSQLHEQSKRVDAFYKKYPKLYGGTADFYFDKCDSLSVLFNQFLIDEFKINNSFVIVGMGLDYSDTDWITNPSIATLRNLQNKKHRTGHVVVNIDDVVYDMSSKQFYSGSFSIYPLHEFKKRWKVIRDMSNTEYNVTLIKAKLILEHLK